MKTRIVVRAFGCLLIASLAAALAYGEPIVWKAGDGDWATPENWSPKKVPTAADDVTIPAHESGTITVTASGAIAAHDLTVGGDAGGQVVFCSSGAGSVVHAVSGNLTIAAGGTLTHADNTGATTKTADSSLVKLAFTVGGNMTVEAGGEVTAIGAGYPKNQGPGVAGSVGGTHGGHGGPIGTGTAGVPCYGSVTAPVTLGSGGSYSAGGGAVRFAVTGTCTVNGLIDVSGYGSTSIPYYSGAGGSVYITCAELAGNGQIQANGGSTYTNGSGWDMSGGGGRISIVTEADGMAGWTGHIHAWGGRNTLAKTYGGYAGTVYYKIGEAKGRVVVDNGAPASRYQDNTSAFTGYIGASFSSIDEGPAFLKDVDLEIDNGGIVCLMDGQSVGDISVSSTARFDVRSGNVSFYGSIANDGTFCQRPGTTFILAGADDATLKGSLTFTQFVCEEPGKTIYFDGTFQIAANKTMTLRGAPGNLLKLRPATADTAWALKLNEGVQSDCAYLDVEWSDASSGLAVSAMDSLGAAAEKNNVNWIFPHSPIPGEQNDYLGTSSGWNDTSNWSLFRVPVAGDHVVIRGGTAYPAVLLEDKEYHQLTVESGGTLDLNGFNLTVSNELAVAGTVTAVKGETIRVFSDFTLAAGNDLSGAHLEILGDAAQSVGLSGVSVGSVQVTKSGGSLAFTSVFSAGMFLCRPTAALAVTFASGGVFAADKLLLIGDAGAPLSLAPSDSGAWCLTATPRQFVSGVTVSGCDASSGAEILADALSTDGQGNDNWVFGADVHRWTGAVDGDFRKDGNWAPSGVPTATSRAVFIATDGSDAGMTISAGDAVSVGSILLWAPQGSMTVTSKARLVADAVEVFENGTLALDYRSADDTNEVGSVHIAAGGALTHSANTTAKTATADESLIKLALHVTGDMTVDADGAVTAIGAGYPTGQGPGVAGQVGGTHGGHGGPIGTGYAGVPCYGSVTAPVTLGSGGSNSAGGGAICLAVSGTLTVKGLIDGSGYGSESIQNYAGAGGSVYITCAALAGNGQIQANGGSTAGNLAQGWDMSGGGGRISIVTAADGMAGWTGHIHAWGGRGTLAKTYGGYAGTVYYKIGEAKGRVVVDNGAPASRYQGDTSAFTASIGADFSAIDEGPAFLKDVDLEVDNGGIVCLMDGQSVGDISVSSTARLDVRSGNVSFYGSIANAGMFCQRSGTTFTLAGEDDATLEGSFNFMDFACAVPGKTIYFDGSFQIAANKAMTLRGASGNLLKLRPATAGTAWTLKLNEGVQTDCAYLDVEWSNASSGLAVSAMDSLGAAPEKNNVNWLFSRTPILGEKNEYLGTSSGWNDTSNWSLSRVPVTGDHVVIKGGTDYPAVLLEAKEYYQLTVESGGTLKLNGFNLTVSNEFAVAGTLEATHGEVIRPLSDFTLAAGNDLSGAHLEILGDAAQSVGLCGVSVGSVQVTKSGGSLAFTNGFSAARFACQPTAALAVTFAPGGVFAADELLLIGGAGAPLSLAPSGSGAWCLKATPRQFVSGVTVAGCNASSGTTILADASCKDGQGNVNWVFGADVRRWTGAVDGDFRKDGNWAPSGVPTATSRAVFIATDGSDAGMTISAGDAVRVGSVFLWAPQGSMTVTSKARLVADAVEILENGTLALDYRSADDTNEVGSVHIAAGGALTHSANSSATAATADADLIKLELHVTGDMTIEAGGAVTAVGKGYGAGKGPSGSGGSRAPSHGGRGVYFSGATLPCYGSIEHPVTLGSGGSSSPGGGAIRLIVSGTLTVNGAIDASGLTAHVNYSGAGGSAWITCSTLAGAGAILADGAVCHAGSGGINLGGGGGRVALETPANGRAGWTGAITAYGGVEETVQALTPAGYAGTVCIKEGNARPEIIVDNGGGHVVTGHGEIIGTDFPGSDDSADFLKSAALTIRNGGHVTVFSNMTIGDVALGDDGYLTLQDDTHVVIRDRKHRKGRGWTGTTSPADAVATERITWKTYGLVICIQ